MSYDLADLALVLEIAESGSLTAAAARVGLAPSSASARLARLEAALNLRLFDRRARGLSPTVAGAQVVCHARKIFHQLAKMQAELAMLETPSAQENRRRST
ncbi:helix-turn-helix domain-containing protein [Azospira restricta]|uniref:LysR family transcriptional regulator n=1 Tax=Azospira restricta TaxID=404405 RepID=A0A974PY34_9RHOO|nr:LysR family transcriptional regulator [Azospira restricta]QRJ63291.1 LysR family transcriptional regulator [Azospira restricta]